MSRRLLNPRWALALLSFARHRGLALPDDDAPEGGLRGCAIEPGGPSGGRCVGPGTGPSGGRTVQGLSVRQIRALSATGGASPRTGWGGPPRRSGSGPQDRVPAVSPGAQSRPVRQRRRTAAAARYRCGSIDLRIFATIVKFGSTTFAISYSAACPMNVCAPRSVIP
jgi:hypothetical protein